MLAAQGCVFLGESNEGYRPEEALLDEVSFDNAAIVDTRRYKGALDLTLRVGSDFDPEQDTEVPDGYQYYETDFGPDEGIVPRFSGPDPLLAGLYCGILFLDEAAGEYRVNIVCSH